jgi:hypothetical protein
MTTLLSLLVYLIVLGILWWAVGLLPLPDPIRTAITIVFVLLLIYPVLTVLGIVPGGLPHLRLG